MNIAVTFIIGVIVGFGIEWAVDFFFLRDKSRKLENELEQVRNDNSELQAQINFLETGEMPNENIVEAAALEPDSDGEFVYLEEVAPLDESEFLGKGVVDEEPETIAEDPLLEKEEWITSDSRSSDLSLAGVAAAGMAAAVLHENEDEVVHQSEEGLTPGIEIDAEELATIAEDPLDASLPEPVDGADWVLEETDEEAATDPEPIEMAGAKARQDIEFVEGIGPTYGSLLREIGINNPQTLLDRGATVKGRSEIAEQTAIPTHFILKWVNQVDLYRIKGIGSEYAEILESAGVNTVLELAQRNPENLHAKLVEMNAEHKRVRQLPSIDQVTDWISMAKDLPRIVSY